MINQYRRYIRDTRGMAENTVNCYCKDLQHFITWAKANITQARWSTITRDDIDRYISAQCAQGLAPATTNRRLASISSFYNFLRRQGWLKTNPCKYESRRKVSQSIPNTIPVQDLNTAYKNSHGVVKVMLGILANSGIRIQEMLDLTWQDIDWAHYALKINGKGGKGRIVYTGADALETLAIVKAEKAPSGRIFTMDQRTARNMLYNALVPYSNAPQLSPHAIRHTLATNMAMKGANVITIAEILGHKHISTTQKYIDMTSAPVRAACEQYKIIN